MGKKGVGAEFVVSGTGSYGVGRHVPSPLLVYKVYTGIHRYTHVSMIELIGGKVERDSPWETDGAVKSEMFRRDFQEKMRPSNHDIIPVSYCYTRRRTSTNQGQDVPADSSSSGGTRCAR